MMYGKDKKKGMMYGSMVREGKMGGGRSMYGRGGYASVQEMEQKCSTQSPRNSMK
jgi:hypothetical protein